MASFLSDVLSSLAASGVVVFLGWAMSSRLRRWLVRLLSLLTGTGVLRTYQRQLDAEDDLSRDIARARWLKVLTGRGNALTRDAFAPVWSRSASRVESAWILLPDPERGPDSWLGQREDDVRRFDPGFTPGLLAEQVRANSAYLGEVARTRAGVELRYYDLPNIYRVVATDRAAYITFYESTAHGRHSPCVYAQRPGPLYDAALRMVSAAWRGSRPAVGARAAGPRPLSEGGGSLPG
ncbi:hypothetical protein [Marinitenerispora sediminis]|uniref:Uncharacterized protein n=1 Tax=Marinitenerispora sediminis TaxID=1931232 RepID=A0A368T0D0_9ACTN|nr:hypothetical protein [Marinitenerispora sediminis]RCV50995.1 hypothetical protein DEF28_16560 [Marinitenerispora sediminis]RCV52489.1 hypothetical protein DEF24_21930 [Marinitenerispora sediminis]RCV53840.1 hypothetical protein DEF23_16890 [Marinitenerispora sediminis]